MAVIFDRNQTEFTSVFQREVWWWAIGIVPIAESLADEVVSRCSPDVLLGCRQWSEYFVQLCEDMAANESLYLPGSPRQYRDVLERISAGGEILGDDVVWNASEWEAYAGKIDRGKAYSTSGLTTRYCLDMLARLGLTVHGDDERVSFSNSRFPKVFHAMRMMENSPNVRDTTVRHHFAQCEFRQFFKSYNAGYNELLRRASDDSLCVARELHEFAKASRLIRYIHFGMIKYKHKGIRICDYNLYCHDTPTLRMRIGAWVINPTPSDLPEIYARLRERINEIDSGGQAPESRG